MFPASGALVALLCAGVYVAADSPAPVVDESEGYLRPVVKWGQNSKQLFVTINARGCAPEEKPDSDRQAEPTATVQIGRREISFTCKPSPAAAAGADAAPSDAGAIYDVRIPLTRPIAPDNSTYALNSQQATFSLLKTRQGPCWRSILPPKKAGNSKWKKKQRYQLVRDHGKTDTDDCQMWRDLWREEYFKARLRGQNALTIARVKAKRDRLRKQVEAAGLTGGDDDTREGKKKRKKQGTTATSAGGGDGEKEVEADARAMLQQLEQDKAGGDDSGAIMAWKEKIGFFRSRDRTMKVSKMKAGGDYGFTAPAP